MNVLDFVDAETGKFTDDFKGNIGSIVGDEHKDTKVFDAIPDVGTALKVLVDTKSKLGKKMEGVIQKPQEGATKEKIAEYRTALCKELGAPDSADDYEFVRPDDLPEGMKYNEEVEKGFREFFFKHGVSADTVKEVSQVFNKIQIDRFNAHLEAENKKFQEDLKALKSDWKGDAMVKNAKTALAAIQEFGDDALKSLLKDAKIHENAGNLEKWRDVGFDPTQLRIWAKIGERMKSVEAPSSEAGGDGSKSDTDTTLKTVYDHPTSQKELLANRKQG